MKSLLRRARDILVVAPHPDDETIGAYGLMRTMRARGAKVRVIIVSDGAASHPGSLSWPTARLIDERQRETRRAMATLGLSRKQIAFLGLPDGALVHQVPRLERNLGRSLRRGRRPDLIIGPTQDDHHADHHSVASALARVAPRGVRRLGYRVWPLRQVKTMPLKLRLSPDTMRAKRVTLQSYRTQTGRITDALAGFTMTSRHIARFVRPVEQFVLLA